MGMEYPADPRRLSSGIIGDSLDGREPGRTSHKRVDAYGSDQFKRVLGVITLTPAGGRSSGIG